jgi:DNA replication protein DnaC
MMNEQTLHLLQSMRLHGMAKGFADRLNTPAVSELSHADFVALLAQDEKTHRENLRLGSLLKNARLRYKDAAVENVNYRHPRGLAKQALLQFQDTAWITAHRNVLITGPTGVGKSWLACALGNLAARQGFTVRYWRTPRLWETLHQARGDGSHLKTLTTLGKAQVLILDDFLLSPLSDAERKDALEIIEDRYATASTILTSQLDPRHWHEAIGDPTLADALCDRLLHNAYKLDLKGASIRKDGHTTTTEDIKR